MFPSSISVLHIQKRRCNSRPWHLSLYHNFPLFSLQHPFLQLMFSSSISRNAVATVDRDIYAFPPYSLQHPFIQPPPYPETLLQQSTVTSMPFPPTRCNTPSSNLLHNQKYRCNSRTVMSISIPCLSPLLNLVATPLHIQKHRCNSRTVTSIFIPFPPSRCNAPPPYPETPLQQSDRDVYLYTKPFPSSRCNTPSSSSCFRPLSRNAVATVGPWRLY